MRQNLSIKEATNMILQSYHFGLTEYKTFFRLATVPALLSAFVITLVQGRAPLIWFVGSVMSIIITTPFMKSWYRYSLSSNTQPSFEKSLIWDKDTSRFFLTFIKLYLLVLVLLAPFYLALMFLASHLGSPSHLGGGALMLYGVGLFSYYICCLSLWVRAYMILPACLENKPLTLKQAWEKTGGTFLPVVVSMILNMIVMLCIVVGLLLLYAFIDAIFPNAPSGFHVLSAEHPRHSASNGILLRSILSFLAYFSNAVFGTFVISLYKHFTSKKRVFENMP